VKPYLKKSFIKKKKRAGGMAQGEGPEFKPQYTHTHTKYRVRKMQYWKLTVKEDRRFSPTEIQAP
jgi:hypothetical protein